MSSGVPVLDLCEKKLWVLRPTGELFDNYEDYLAQFGRLRQRIWTCNYTGKTNLTYEECLVSEEKARALLQTFPDAFQGPVLQLVHHNTLRLEDLAQCIVAHFRERFVPGEEVLGKRDGELRPCRIVSATDPDTSSMARYAVQWISSTGMGEEGSYGTLTTAELQRAKLPFSKSFLKRWIQDHATCETIQGVKNLPCIWRASDELAAKFHLPRALPAHLVMRLDMGAREPKAKRPRLTPKETRSLKEEGTAIALAVFAEVAAAKAGAAGRGPPAAAAPPLGPLSPSFSNEKESSAQKFPVETLEETDLRIGPRYTMKRLLFETLKEAGPDGLDVQTLMEKVEASGLKHWDDKRSGKVSVASTCAHDAAFTRVSNRIALRALRPATEPPQGARGPGRLGSGSTSKAVISHVPDAEKVLEKLRAQGDTPGEARIDKNSFKCTRCHKTIHPEFSPLVLCDGCPRSFHLTCLEVDFADLPEGDWECPKCDEKRALSYKKAIDNEARRQDGFSRTAFYSQIKDEKLRKRLLEKEERDRSRDMAKAEKDRMKAREREERERLKEEARRSCRHPIDDLRIMNQEAATLGRVEVYARDLATAVARVNAGLDPGRLPEPPFDAGAMLAAEAQEASEEAPPTTLEGKAAAAAARVAQLRAMIDGPPRVPACVRGDSARCSFNDSLAIVEFLYTFGAICETPPLGLADLQRAVCAPLAEPTLRRLYVSILRAAVSSLLTQDGYLRSRGRRWARACSEATVQEILQRYLKTSRAAHPVPARLLEGDFSQLDDHAAALSAARILASEPYYRQGPRFHLRLLAVLCNDAVEAPGLKNEIAARIDAVQTLHQNHRAYLAEERKRQLEEEKMKKAKDNGKAEEEAVGEATNQAADQATVGEAPDSAAPVDVPSGDGAATTPAPPSATPSTSGRAREKNRERLPARSSLRSQGQMTAHQATPPPPDPGASLDDKGTASGKVTAREASEAIEEAAPPSPPRTREEERAVREAQYEEAVRSHAVRTEPLGFDRFYRRYYWLEGVPAGVFVEEADGAPAGLVSSKEQLDAILAGLNPRGVREKQLHKVLTDRYEDLLAVMGQMPLLGDIQDTIRQLPEGQRGEAEAPEEVEARLEREAMQAACERVEGLVCALEGYKRELPGGWEEWKGRFRQVKTPAELLAGCLEMEKHINWFGDGLPRGARDEFINAILEEAGAGPYHGARGMGTHRFNQSKSDLGDQEAKQEADLEAGGDEDAKPEPDQDGNGKGPSHKAIANNLQGGDSSDWDGAGPVKLEPREQVPGLAGGSRGGVHTAKIEAPTTGSPGRKQPLEGSNGDPARDRGAGTSCADQNGVPANGALKEEPGASEERALEVKEEVRERDRRRRVNSVHPSEVDDNEAGTKDDGEGDGGGDDGNGLASGSAVARALASLPSGIMPPPPFSLCPVGVEPLVPVESRGSDALLAPSPFDDLDNTDDEGAQGTRARRALWRSARERAVWIRDARRITDLYPAVYAAFVFVDRMQPLLGRMSRQAAKAEAEQQRIEAEEAAAAAAAAAAAKAAAARERKRAARSEPGDGPPVKNSRIRLKAKGTGAGASGDPDTPPGGGAQPVDRWSSTCAGCGYEGDLLCCEAPTCTDAMHVECAGLTEIPEGSWFCPKHSGRKRTANKAMQRSESRDPEHEDSAALLNGSASKQPRSKAKAKKARH
eukprot:jgi/Botrbrau1/16217/Bobra.0066s0004.1